MREGLCQCFGAGRTAKLLSGGIRVSARRRQLTLRVRAIGWDPEGVLGTPQAGHIQRRMLSKRLETDREFANSMKQVKDETRRQVLARRATRSPPVDHSLLVDYLLNTETEDMEFEVARCRPQLNPDFFRFLDTEIGQERFLPQPNDERLAELDALRQYLSEAVQAVDTAVEKTSSAADRLKKLLSSPDKKACILEMAGNNEIDQGLIDLLQQNIAAAKAAGQDKPAEFMEKVLGAASKYLITTA